ncbi:MAG: EAL domain-containing protein [Wenzhouxiangellaceae bacterium]|nr:EAL domain-containing protein [Wenzhouxiangellaceae bacterium]
MDHRCQCRSADRRLALIFGQVDDHDSEIAELVDKFGMEWDDELSTAVTRVGPNARFAHAADVRDLLLAVLGREQTKNVRADWVEPGALAEQAVTLLKADSIDRFAPEGRTPLADLLERRQLRTFFQPILDRAGSVWGYELLMRAFDDDGGLISPARILEWAERENLLFMLDRVARETHIRSAARCRTPDHAKFLINFTPTVIYEPSFCLRTTFEAVRANGLDPERIVFEVIETTRIEDPSRLRRILDHYREAGFGVALDDVSAGYSGLSMLADLEPDLVKIDRDIVQRANDSAAHMEIVRSLVSLGRRMGKLVLAEGIETEAQHSALRSEGVDLFQGFLLGRPAPEPVGIEC